MTHGRGGGGSADGLQQDSGMAKGEGKGPPLNRYHRPHWPQNAPLDERTQFAGRAATKTSRLHGGGNRERMQNWPVDPGTEFAIILLLGQKAKTP